MPAATRYILMPGYIRSQIDGDAHYIDSYTLKRLYRLPLDAHAVTYPAQGMRPEPGDVHLFPRNDGNYNLPT